MKRGDLVQCWFDTGAMGAMILYGHVMAAGSRTFTVQWESGLKNRRQQAGDDQAEACRALRHLLGRKS